MSWYVRSWTRLKLSTGKPMLRGGEQMIGARVALVATVSAVVLGLSASASAAGTSTSSGTVTSGSAGASSAAHCPRACRRRQLV